MEMMPPVIREQYPLQLTGKSGASSDVCDVVFSAAAKGSSFRGIQRTLKELHMLHFYRKELSYVDGVRFFYPQLALASAMPANETATARDATATASISAPAVTSHPTSAARHATAHSTAPQVQKHFRQPTIQQAMGVQAPESLSFSEFVADLYQSLWQIAMQSACFIFVSVVSKTA